MAEWRHRPWLNEREERAKRRSRRTWGNPVALFMLLITRSSGRGDRRCFWNLRFLSLRFSKGKTGQMLHVWWIGKGRGRQFTCDVHTWKNSPSDLNFPFLLHKELHLIKLICLQDLRRAFWRKQLRNWPVVNKSWWLGQKEPLMQLKMTWVIILIKHRVKEAQGIRQSPEQGSRMAWRSLHLMLTAVSRPWMRRRKEEGEEDAIWNLLPGPTRWRGWGCAHRSTLNVWMLQRSIYAGWMLRAWVIVTWNHPSRVINGHNSRLRRIAVCQSFFPVASSVLFTTLHNCTCDLNGTWAMDKSNVCPLDHPRKYACLWVIYDESEIK